MNILEIKIALITFWKIWCFFMEKNKHDLLHHHPELTKFTINPKNIHKTINERLIWKERLYKQLTSYNANSNLCI